MRTLTLTRQTKCTIPGCTRKYRARGWCATHYSRWQNTGTTDAKKPTERCGVGGCVQSPRSTYAEYCETHYYRLRRTGSVADPVRIEGPCQVEECSADATYTNGHCRMHYLRLQARGDVSFELKGDNHPYWTGDAATSRALHQRIKARRGQARTYLCIDCGAPARHWSYDHSDPHEKHDPEKGPYSLDITRYDPRCVSCHKRFDMAYLRSQRVDA